MTALLSFLSGNPAILGVLASLIAALGWGFHQRLAGAKAERDRQAASEAAARNIADQVDNDIGALPVGAVKKELKSWARD
ncbi:ABC transporter permease [Mesorhizobium sp. VK23B]|uniref:ABC transporter permease n=1 Tax=Mesorhizobium dulcispinae TaxID=3072316 RepID=A0ABU4XM25_9HYPH|nr:MULTISPECIES: ABC transporter permease [unclassified Mesorhizobium]MDX8468930.1 ABC transporter permease [Mesorhizobium sp. VK23B]MDX8475281.1 ABC transporter permease [Mesorhizobium sp. VK23A]MDX8520887.1 ABC transporter permease [Mesorhizobium sp. VK23D]